MKFSSIVKMTFKTDHEILPLLLENQRTVLHSPLKNSQLIKYTCFAISKNYLIFGATSGGLYVFKRYPYTFHQLIPSKESSITAVAISLSENLVACATNKNIVRIVELSENCNGKLVTRTEDLSDCEITALCWTEENATPTLFIGDSGGRVSYLKLSFLSKNILNIPTTLFMSLDSKIVQICCDYDLLVVSTLTRCYLCDIIREHYRQIGQQLRDGLYGVTFLKNRKRIFCARPGCRLWEVDLQGDVHSTHQFKRQLSIPSSTFVSLFNEPKIYSEDSHLPSSSTSFNFVKLFDLLGQYIVTYNGNAVYILNTDKVNVLFWCNCFGSIVDVQCIFNSVFVWNSTGDLYELVFLPVEKYVLTLYLKGFYDLCVHILYVFREKLFSLDSLSELYPLVNLEWPMEKNGDEEVDQKMKILIEFKEKLQSLASKEMKLRSGIHVVNNQHLSRRLLDDSVLSSHTKDISLIVNGSGIVENGEYRKRSNSLPSSLKNVVTEGQVPVSDSSHSFHTNQRDELDSSFPDGELYNSPFVTFASYHILRENFSELSSNFSQIFSDSSRNFKKKWLTLENKITSRAQEINSSIPVISVDSVSSQGDDETFENGDNEPIVEKRKIDSTNIAVTNCDELTLLYDYLQSNSSTDVNLFQSLHSVMLSWTEKNSFLTALIAVAPTAVKDVFASRCFMKPFLNEWFSSEYFPVNSSCSIRDHYPPLLTRLFNDEEFEFDFFLSGVLAVFCPLLDARNILDKVKSFQLPCYYRSFCCVLKHFQKDDPSNYERLEGDRIDWPAPVYLNTMLLMISVDRVDVFCEMGAKKLVDAMDIIYMLLHVAQVDSKEDIVVSSYDYRHVWLNYLQKLLREQNLNCLVDVNVLRLALHVLVSCGTSQPDLCCPNCWFLLPQAHLYRVEYESLGRAILSRFWSILMQSFGENSFDYSTLLSLRRAISDTCEYHPYISACYKNVENCQHLLCQMFNNGANKQSPNDSSVLALNALCNLCYRIPFLWKHLSALQASSPVRLFGVLQLIQLDDVEQLQMLHSSSMNEDEAKIIFDSVASLSEGRCLNCGAKVFDNCNRVSWDNVGMFVLQRLGASRTLKLLRCYASPRVNLSSSFYRSALLISLPKIGPEFTDRVLSIVSNHCHTNHISSSNFAKLRNAYERDNASQKSNSVSAPASDAHHWGISVQAEQTNQAICYCCSLPLFSKSLIKEYNGGITVFSCSHTYHTICLKNKNCALSCIVCDRFLR